MPLQPGSKLGHYEIVSALGAGGMGEVYRARDTELGREVALKLLLDEVSSDPDRLARFRREARVLASLNHANVATLYGFFTATPAPGDGAVEARESAPPPDSPEREAEVPFLVMELVEGETLADRIARGPIPANEAVAIFIEIAKGLESAHEKGIVHRDLKPANVKLGGGDASAGVKILDFGLAKAMAPEAEAPDASASLSPTLTLAATQRGQILGTAAYMSPEQARGRDVDRRADVWAFGACLYEALTGRRAFAGEDAADVLGSVLKLDPDWEALPRGTDPRLRRLLERCLEKRREDRLRDVGDAGLELREVRERPAQEPAVSAPSPTSRLALVAGLAALAVGLAVGTLVTRALRPEEPKRVVRAILSAPPSPAAYASFTGLDVAIAPDGDLVVYEMDASRGSFLRNRNFCLRHVDELEGSPLFDTSASGFSRASPFISADGAWIGFSDYQEGMLKKVPVRGGVPTTICRLPNVPFSRGATWGPDGTIVFATAGDRGLFRVADTGGDPVELTQPDAARGEHRHYWPELLPGGETVLFSIDLGETSEIAALSLDDGSIRRLVAGGGGARYARTGHLVFGREGALYAAPFDAATLTVEGEPVPVVEGVLMKSSGAVDFDLSDDGRLVYMAGDMQDLERRRLVWVDRGGAEEPIPAELRAYNIPRISPDGARVAIAVNDGEVDIWSLELATGTLSRVTVTPEFDSTPLWSSDGGRILFSSIRDGRWGVFSKSASGAGTAELVAETPTEPILYSLSPDGSRLVYRMETVATDDGRRVDTFALRLDGEPHSEPLLASRFVEQNAEISPDGRWLAYSADDTGESEIYVRPFPEVEGGRWQISTGGSAFDPIWSRDGRELFYRQRNEYHVVPVETGETFRHGASELMFRGNYFFQTTERTWDVSPDGRRFLMIGLGESGASGEAPPPPNVVIVENWFEELKQLVPRD